MQQCQSIARAHSPPCSKRHHHDLFTSHYVKRCASIAHEPLWLKGHRAPKSHPKQHHLLHYEEPQSATVDDASTPPKSQPLDKAIYANPPPSLPYPLYQP
ncbi:hypothetical protein CR513_28671, partial [Mucuna pruriens]